MGNKKSMTGSSRSLIEIDPIEERIKKEQLRNAKLLKENKDLEIKYRIFQSSLIGKTIYVYLRIRRTWRQCLKIVQGKKSYRQVFDKRYKKQKAEQRVTKFKRKLEEGFEKRILKELEKDIQRVDNHYLVSLSAWELVLWYARKQTYFNKLKALDCIKIMGKSGYKSSLKHKKTIIEAELLHALGMSEKAISILENFPETHYSSIDENFAKANICEDPQEKIGYINRVFNKYDQCVLSKEGLQVEETLFNQLRIDYECCEESIGGKDLPKVSIIVPVYNAENSIKTVVNSLINQTWSNIEVIIVDDGSTDETLNIIRYLAERDSRISCYSTEEYSGNYSARNIGLKVATGEYVTVNGPDEWAHPQKIAYQANHLMHNPDVIANTSLQVCVTEELSFMRVENEVTEYTFSNKSSLMYLREKVIEKLGFWDMVSFGGSQEFVSRLIRIFGQHALVNLTNGVYSFRKADSTSVVLDGCLYKGWQVNAYKEYAESHDHYHESGGNLKYPFPQEVRPFPIPAPMKPKRVVNKGERRHFDVIIASEFRLLGGTNMSNIEEIKAQKQHGLKTGLVQLSRYDLNSVERINPQVRETIDGDRVEMIVYGEKVSCDVLIVRHPPALQEWQKYVPDVKAGRVEVIVNQPPQRDYGEKGERLYSFKECVKHLKMYFGQEGTWYPIGPEIRKTLDKYHKAELDEINLAEEDWVNIIHVDEWWRGRYTREEGSPIRIGRHSRDQYVKWPESREKMMLIYPTEGPYEIHVLGGAKSPKKVLGELPSNWNVKEFGEESPQSFLKRLDVFVYYTHSDWVEAFGRVIFEAMAAGVPVVIEPKYKDLFGEAAIYAEPEEVLKAIEKLMSQPERYEAQVEKAKQYVDEHFGYVKHITRIARDRYGK
ncbi:glycosyltransferase [Salipaludibacillus agaradhaerens]|uniref:glycosyltransferase n=1 Tax=Salipaludibacillus agaradhaerens TaxID=76935 RepID=UPI0014732421|nr:glycosyltransferase [Salipaludibacillus agaradhaerens]